MMCLATGGRHQDRNCDQMRRERDFHDASVDAFVLKDGRIALRIEGVNVSTEAELSTGEDWLLEYGVLTIDSVSELLVSGVAQTLENRTYGQFWANISSLELTPDWVEMSVQWRIHDTDARRTEWATYRIRGQTRWNSDGPPQTVDEWAKTRNNLPTTPTL
jgi:hypothetical protein